MDNKPTVNDNNGFLNNEGLCDSLLLDLNNLTKILLSGQYIQFCAMITEMAQKIVNLKSGIKTDMGAMVEKVDELKRMNNSLIEQINGVHVDKGGADNGGS